MCYASQMPSEISWSLRQQASQKTELRKNASSLAAGIDQIRTSSECTKQQTCRSTCSNDAVLVELEYPVVSMKMIFICHF